MSELNPEEILLLAQAALSPGAPVKVRSYVKRSTTGKQVVVRQAIRGAVGRTAINPPVAQTTPVISNKAIQSETAAARAGVAQQRAATLKAQKQAAALLKQQKQQAAAQKKQAAAKKKQKQPKAQPKTAQPKTPKAPHLGNLRALGALHGGGGGHGLYALQALRGRRGRLFPGSGALSKAMERSRKAKEAKNKEATKASKFASREQARSESLALRNQQRTKGIAAREAAKSPSLYHTSPLHRSLYQASARKVDAGTRHSIEAQHGRYTEEAHRALEIAAAYRRAHAHGKHATGAGFHEKLAGEVIKHEAKRLSHHLHLSAAEPDEAILLSQEALRIEGYAVDVTGIMDDSTANALASFLKKQGVDIDAEH